MPPASFSATWTSPNTPTPEHDQMVHHTIVCEPGRRQRPCSNAGSSGASRSTRTGTRPRAYAARPALRLPRVRHPWANLVLLALLAGQLVTGFVGLLGASDPYRILFWAHAVGAYAIVVVLFAKGAVVLDVLRR